MLDDGRRKPRQGTSIHQFRAEFPDAETCLQHVFMTRFGAAAPCPKCQRPAKWYRIRRTRSYATNCCQGRHIFPLSGTVFDRSPIPLDKWFYAILHFCNASAGTVPDFLARHLGISGKAAVRMADRIRGHLREIDRNRLIGGLGKTVYIDEAKLLRVHDMIAGSRKQLRLLVACDETDFIIAPFSTRRPNEGTRNIYAKIRIGSDVLVRNAKTFNNMCNYSERNIIYGLKTTTSKDPYHVMYNELSVMIIALKQFIGRNHAWITQKYIENYIASFAFVYRRRHIGSDAFRDAISTFPQLQSWDSNSA